MNYKSHSRKQPLYAFDLQEHILVNYFIKNAENKTNVKEKMYIYSCKNDYFSLVLRYHRTLNV